MARPLVGSGAFATSLVAHGLLLTCGALLISHSLRSRPHPPAPPITHQGEVEVELPNFDPSASDQERESETPPEEAEAALPGGGPLTRHADTDRAGRGGSKTAPEAATNLDSHIDPISLETDAPTHLDRSQVQRLRTANARRSWDDHRATPTPMQLTFLATGKGRLPERRVPAANASGSIAGTVAATLGGVAGGALDDVGLAGDPATGAAVAGRQESEPQSGAPVAAPKAAPSRGAQVLVARPWVMRARPALPTEVRARPSDVDDSSQAVSARVAALIHASTIGAPPGPGVGGEPLGGRPGRSGSEGTGSRANPSGFGPGPDALNDPGIQGYVAGLKQRVDDQLRRAFPDWAIEAGRSGHVIFELSVRADGHLERVRMVRPSGIAEYDGNVLNGVQRIASFGPLPKALGQRALITMSYTALNHVIGREGPGPGGYGTIPRATP
ncbi:MAG TPA: TonB family protein [Polyangiaceae bacterium]|nr:TonB family protein [Polyangiaceae bacterium]